MRPRRVAAVAAAVFALQIVYAPGFDTALSFVGDEHTRFDVNRLEVPGMSKTGLRVDPDAAIASELQSSPAWLAWSQSHPGWRVTWNTWTRTAHRAFGPGVRVDFRGTLTSSNVEQACRDFLADNSSWLGVRADELQLVQARKRRDRWYVVFRQAVQGTPVRGGRADLRLGADGTVALVGADWYPDVQVAIQPRLRVDEALVSASSDLGDAPTQVESALQIVPLPGDGGDAEIRYTLAHELRFRTAEPLGSWYALVDAATGELWYRENLIRFLDVEGSVGADVEPYTVGDSLVQVPLRDTRVQVMGTGEFGHTGSDGTFRFPTARVDSTDVRVRLEGFFARVFNASRDNNVTPALVDRLLPGAPYAFRWDDANSLISERDAYYHTLVTHDYIKALDPDFERVDYTMPVTVDITTRQCNAWWDGWGINFLQAGGGCVNSARIASVVYHEYGHGITGWQYTPFAPSGAMHEAFSDYMAATMTDNPIVGEGFRGPGTFVRNVDNDRRFPDDVVGLVHQDGLILGGALWDLRLILGAEVADVLWHFARYGVADNFDDYLLDILVTDDDNSNIYDGTPNFDGIIEAFMAHGIGDYSVQITHAPLIDTEDGNKPLDVDATILSIFQLEPGSARMHYRIDGGAWVEVALLESPVRQFSASIPQQPFETTVDYYITATDVQGTVGTMPASAPDQPFTFRVGTDTTAPVITFTPVLDRPADAISWRVAADVTDNLDQPVTSVVLEYSVNSTALDLSLPFVQETDARWSLQLPVGGAVLADVVHYRVRATDGAGVPNVQLEPPTDSHSFNVVTGWLRDFEADDAAFVSTEDWQWGEPTSGPGAAFSGTRLWATNLSGNHSDNMTATLQLPMLDLTSWGSASLAFRHWYSTERSWDGARVEVSTNGGASWNPLVPNAGYPSRNVAALQGPGYDGDSDGWEAAEFDLALYLGAPLWIRLNYSSDSGVNAPGWYVDDVEVVDRQVIGVPLELATRSGEDSRVSLSWQPPGGTSPSLPWNPVLGYHVYRSLQTDFSDALRISSSLLANPAFVDTGLVNGTTYWYAVSATYDEGESALTDPVEALPFVAEYSAEVAELDIENETAALDTSVTFVNTGTGFLRMNVWVADEGQTIDDVRIAYDVPQAGLSQHSATSASRFERNGARDTNAPRSASAYELLFTDTQELEATPDLKELWAQVVASELWFQVTGHENWGNILTDFTMIIGLDTDTNRDTGRDNFDFYVLMGRFPMQNFGAPAIVADSRRRFVGLPTRTVFPPDAAILEVGFPLALVGSPRRLYAGVLAFNDDAFEALVDAAPNIPAATAWLQLANRYLEVEAGQPEALGMQFSADIPAGEYAGQLLFETNAPATPAASLPVSYRFISTPVLISELAVAQDRNDVVLSWRAHDARDVARYRVFRAREAAGLTPLHPDVLLRADGEYRYRDVAPPPGRYTYRVGEVTTGGDVVLHGGVELEVVRAVPLRAFLDPATPNPFNPSTTLAYGVAEPGPLELVVFDSRGRRVRTLARNPRMAAGFYREVWDGLDDAGREVASGVYHARLVVGGRAFSKRLTLLK